MDYRGRRWLRKRQTILRLDGYTDQIQKRYGRIIAANTVHHIYPADDYPQYAYEDWNLIAVSKETHNSLHDRDTRELTDEGRRLMRKTKPGVNWRMKCGTNV